MPTKFEQISSSDLLTVDITFWSCAVEIDDDKFWNTRGCQGRKFSLGSNEARKRKEKKVDWSPEGFRGVQRIDKNLETNAQKLQLALWLQKEVA